MLIKIQVLRLDDFFFLTTGLNDVNVIIPLNRYSFFEELQDRMLVPMELEFNIQLQNDDELLQKLGVVDDGLSINLFCAISENPDNRLNKLVPPIITPNYNLRKTRKFRVPVAKTKRFAESFIMKGAQLA